MTEAAPVVELAEYVKARGARDALVRLAGEWDWFLGGEVEVRPSGSVFRRYDIVEEADLQRAVQVLGG